MARSYTQSARAKAQDDTRERIVLATMHLHDEQGVAFTSFADVAKRAGIGAATVYRHFPTLGSLVMACGAHVWAEMQPPTPDQASAAFDGLVTRAERLTRLTEELHAFYQRGALRLTAAYADRARVPELDAFLNAVEGGVAAWVIEALKGEALPKTTLQLGTALCDFAVWGAMQKVEVDETGHKQLWVQILTCSIAKAQRD